ncbi:hypothetical protein I350_00183 [Cryptococcus amylolentus CBS 6273]|uniref:separase n=1 Tax=Cryptococcus amylolentus CBS 6273 TaxID=1296118 RepID=A0A1E3KE74_9TREE|nr:hypothetical protein I350_00183 [Cryptococcus amylolentus CBS 6273]
MPPRTAEAATKMPPKAPVRRPARANPGKTPDELADDIGKLAITKPEPKARATGPKAASSKTSIPPTRKTPAPATAKGKGRAKEPLAETIPWACAAAADNFKPVERASQAMQAVNTSLKSISQAEAAGYRYGQGKVVEREGGDWTDETADTTAELSMVGFAVLRELDKEGAIGKKGIEVERVCQVIVHKMLVIGMTKQAIEILCKTKSALFRLYSPIESEPSSSEPKPPTTSASSSRTTVRPAAKAPARPTPASSSKAPASVEGDVAVPASWLDTASYPSPRDGSEIPDLVRSLLFSAVLSSWTSLVSYSQGSEEVIGALWKSHSDHSSFISPLVLARSLSRPSITPALYAFYRAVSSLAPPATSPIFLPIRRIALFALSLTITATAESKNSPTQLWETTHRIVAAVVNARKDEARLSEATEAVLSVVEWVEKILEARGEDGSGWFSGKGWSGLADMWIALGRKLGDSNVIDKALSLMAASASFSSPVSTPKKNGISPAPSTPQAAPLAKFEGQPDTEVTRIRGVLAKASLSIDKILLEASPPSLPLEGLSRQELSSLGQALGMLSEDEDTKVLVERTVRAWERTRRGCVKLFDKFGSQEEWKSVLKDIESWSVAAVGLAEGVSGRVKLDPSLALHIVSGSIDTIVVLSQRNASNSYSLLCRGYGLYQQNKPWTSPSDHINWLRCLSTSAYNIGGKLFTEGAASDATPLIQASCEWGAEAVEIGKSVGDTDKGLQHLQEGLSKRWEWLAGCQQKAGDKKALFASYAECFASQPPSLLTSLSSASSQPVSVILKPFPDLHNTLQRVSTFIFYDPSQAVSFGTDVVEAMGKRLQPFEAGAIGEKLMETIEEGAWKGEVAEIALDIGEGLLGLYDGQYPLRRLRVIARMLKITVASGQRAAQFLDLVEEADRLYSQSAVKEDALLEVYKKEYYAYILILRALQAYHSTSEPSASVLQHQQQIHQLLRELILPPTPVVVQDEGVKKRQPLGRATTTRAAPTRSTRSAQRTVSEPQKKPMATTRGVPAKKGKSAAEVGTKAVAYDDLKRLTHLISSLATLLGLLGMSLAQVEVLKLLRALQRNRDPLFSGYIDASAQLATEYHKLGKISRAGSVFTQAHNALQDSKVLVDDSVQVELLLRWCCYLADTGDVAKAREMYAKAQNIDRHIEDSKDKSRSLHLQIITRCVTLERAAWARTATAAINAAEDNSSAAIMQLSAAFRLWTRASDNICRIAEEEVPVIVNRTTPDDPFLDAPNSNRPTGADEPAKDDRPPPPPQASSFSLKHLDSLQWHVAVGLLNTTFDLASAFAARGSVKDVEYFLKVAGQVSAVVKSGGMGAKTGASEAEILFRLRKYDEVEGRLEGAAALLGTDTGPGMVDILRVQGDLYTRQDLVEEANQVFECTSNEIAGLDATFAAAEALLPTTKSLPTPRKSTSGKEPLLTVPLAHVLVQHAWLLREAGTKDECERLLARIKGLPHSRYIKSQELLLYGRIALHEAFVQFKTDLFMSSLTESAIAMPMGNPTKKANDRQSSRLKIQSVLTRAESSFMSTLDLVAGSGRVEDIRQACLALALLRAFQTALGLGSSAVTSAAADILASSSSITLQRELLQAIDCKFIDVGANDIQWSSSDASKASKPKPEDEDSETECLDDHDGKLRSYWDMIREKYSSNPLLTTESVSLESLPSNWAVVSVNVSDDRNTIFVSRHQKDHEPIVFCLPLDRQGRREGDDETWTFDAAVEELQTIIQASNGGARRARSITTAEGKVEWWAERRALDKRMEELCVNLEFVWLGAFKTIFAPRNRFSKEDLAEFRTNLEKVLQAALSGGRNAKGKKVPPKLHLNDALLECFAGLSSKCQGEEAEDLIYFMLDTYQFHGLEVALSELDMDEIAIDIKSVLEKIEAKQVKSTNLTEEHVFLALDKNVQSFPWESIPILRGRPVSRIPSLSFLLDQVAMGNHLRPSLTRSLVEPGDQPTTQRTVNSRRTFYILNPSGDLARTESHFKPWIDEMVKTAGWKGIVGRAPTELEMKAALRDYDLVLYFGHGGAEQYISSHKIRCLPQCATTMLWGCSSGHLKDQGDFDRTGTAWHYMVAGCPSLVGNLWDVTDRDIDRLSEHVLKQGLHLDSAHQPHSKNRLNTLLPLSELSTVQAVNRARDECKLKYLNGAAPVVYGLPVYLH